jgi:dTDP-4-amino-4,6-dideoxygalactose transaminase
VSSIHAERFAKVKKLRSHGAAPKYFHAFIGGNFRLDAIQAAVLEVKLGHLDAWHEGRQANAARYSELLAPLVDRGLITLPVEVPERRHIWNQFTIRVLEGRRDAVREALKEVGVGNEVYYPRPLHVQECFADLGYQQGQLPFAEEAAREVLSIPIFPELSEAQQDEVSRALGAAFGL